MVLPKLPKEYDKNRHTDHVSRRIQATAAVGRVSRVLPRVPAVRNCTRDEGGPFGFGDQEPIPSHRKLLSLRAMVVSVAEKPGR
jgi:hypothetical protein